MLECYWKGKNIFLRRFGIGSHFSFLVKIQSHEKRIKWIVFIIKIYIFLIFYYNQNISFDLYLLTKYAISFAKTAINEANSDDENRDFLQYSPTLYKMHKILNTVWFNLAHDCSATFFVDYDYVDYLQEIVDTLAAQDDASDLQLSLIHI